MAVGLWPISLATAGGILLWTGINDPAGGVFAVARDLVAGRRPTAGTAKRVFVPGQVTAGPVDPSKPGTNQPSIQGSIRGAGIASVALSYKGAPYRWGGTTMAGIDCSGLVLVSVKKVTGVVLPHDATSQTRRGRIIPRAECAAGDLVAWGSPARYPHIAIAINNRECMGAWTYGVPAGVQPIDQRMYNGLPTIFRLV